MKINGAPDVFTSEVCKIIQSAHDRNNSGKNEAEVDKEIHAAFSAASKALMGRTVGINFIAVCQLLVGLLKVLTGEIEVKKKK